MRVLVVSNLYPPDIIGGYEIKCIEAVEELKSRGHEVRVVTSVPRLPVPVPSGVERVLTLSNVYDVLAHQHSPRVTRRLDDAQTNFVNADNVYRLASEVESFRPDVAYLWNLVGIGGLSLVACLQYLGVPWAWHLFDTVPLVLCEFEGKVVPAVAREFERTIEGRYIACSQGLVNEIEDGGLHIADDVQLVPMWMPGVRPAPRRSYFQGGHLRLIYAGRVTGDKGIAIIIESAARLVREGYANFSIDIYGNVSPAELHLKGLVHEHALEGIMNFMGFRPPADFATLYPEYDVFTFPTWAHEPFAFAPLEAAAHGCVPIMSNDCGNAEWFVHGVDCLKADRTVDSFAGQIRDVLDGRVDLASVGARAEMTVWEQFSLASAIDTAEQTLEQVAKGSRAAAGSISEAYHLAVMAEKVLAAMLKEAS